MSLVLELLELGTMVPKLDQSELWSLLLELELGSLMEQVLESPHNLMGIMSLVLELLELGIMVQKMDQSELWSLVLELELGSLEQVLRVSP
jgi:hypothetical protein